MKMQLPRVRDDLLKKRASLIAGALAGCIAGSVAASTAPTSPIVPTAPELPAFQMETTMPSSTSSSVYPAGDVYQTQFPYGYGVTSGSVTPPTFGAGSYSLIRNPNAAFAPYIGTQDYTDAATVNSTSGIIVEVTTYGSPQPYGYWNPITNLFDAVTTVSDSYTKPVYVPDPAVTSATAVLFFATPRLDPLQITQSVTVATSSSANGDGGYIDGNAGYNPVGANAHGLFLVGSGGYSWLKITSSGKLNTNGAVAYGSSAGAYGGGAFIGTTLLAGSSFGSAASINGGNSSAGYTSLNFGGPSSGYGIVNVDGGTWHDSNGPVYIGYGGQGFVTVQGSGQLNLTNEGLIVGEDSTGLPTTIGTVALPHLAAGIGTVVVESGGTVTLTGSGGYIALGRSVSSSGATGNLYVTGAGSSVNVSQGILVGNGGTGLMDILAGASVTSSSSYAAGQAKAYGLTSQAGNGTIVIDGQNSVWNIAGTADFGETGAAKVTVQNSGNLNITGELTLGDQSTGNGTLLVQSQGTVESGAATLGNQAGAVGTATVTGLNSSWTVDGDLTVGDYGTGSLFLNSNAMLTTTGDATLGSQAASTGAATISDAGTEWQINGELKVGDKGSASLSVENGGYVSLAGNLAIADSGGTSTLTLDGNGSRMIANGTSVTIGGQGDGTLTVQNAADAIFSGASVSLGEKNGANGTLTIQGSNSIMSAGSLTVGGYGTGTLNVQDSASLSTGTNISLGEQASGTGTATIDNASVTDAGTLTIGGYGTGTLTIQNGGSLTVQGNDITLGEQNTGNGTLNLSGGSSTLTFNGDMTIGKSGSGTFAVSGGAHFTGSAMTLASGSGFGGASTGGTGELDINGTSSVLLSQDLTIGKYGVGTLAMQGGAVLANKGDATLGSQPATEGSATISNASNWTVGGNLTIGSQGTGSVTVQSESSLITNGSSLTIGKQGEGSLSVTGTKSLVQYAGDLIIGKQAAGTFSIANGATTAPTANGTGDVYIAETSGINGALTIDGGGSNLAATDLVVGGTSSKAGGTGSVGLTNSGTLAVSKTLTLWDKSSLDVTGGYATIGNAPQSTANGNVYVTSGGELTGSGNITGNVMITSGTVDVGGATAGKLSITGNYAQTGGTLKFTIAGTGSGQASQLDATGGVSLSGSTMEFDFINHYAPTKGQTFQVIDPPQSVNLSGISYTFTGLASGFLFGVSQNANGLLFTALNTGIATSSPAPEPASLAIFSLGAGLLLLRRRRPHRMIKHL
ncbi:MAG: PEP-CTERM sorting domain-containing protein [Phycisphaerales bacterium]|nr:PEP-CTERM sorting domain-containing protein [Phycisphaerales bacterium]